MTGVLSVEAMLRTPAPWRLQFPKDGRKPYEILGPEGELVAVVRIGNLNPPPALCFNGNARLIAAAPELLALAKKLAGECAECRGRGYTFSDDGITGFGPDDREPTREACADCADIREVIAKAEGHLPDDQETLGK